MEEFTAYTVERIKSKKQRVVLLVYLYVNIGILVALIRQPSRGECVK